MNNEAIVVKVNKIEKHPNADKLQIVPLLGTQVVVGLDTKEGDIMVYVDSNMKLSSDFLKHNNLYRHSELNLDITKKGFFEDNARVKMIKLRGEYSDGYLFPFEYLRWAGLVKSLKIGAEFTTINGHLICSKYVAPVEKSKQKHDKTGKSVKKIDIPMFKEHFSTTHFMRNKHLIPADTICYIEEKVHGTSHRAINALHLDISTLPWYKRILMKILKDYKPFKWTYINGTRRVIHTPNRKYKSSISALPGYKPWYIKSLDATLSTYHDNTMREEILEKVRGGLLKGEEIYLELFGHEKTGAQIQKGFPYGTDLKEHRALLYRVTMNNEDGVAIDYNREAVYSKADDLGLEKPKLFEKFNYTGSRYSMQRLEERIIVYAQGQSEMGDGAEDTLKEGVVIWFINKLGKWQALKYKSDKFRLKESDAKDKGIIDPEDIN